MMRRKREIIIPVISMSDIVFLLLIFFMLTSAFLIEPGIKIRLPQTKTAEIQTQKKILITVDENRNIYLNNKKVPLENLEREIVIATAGKRNELLVLRADKSVPHGLVVEILDTAKLAGMERLAIASEKK